MVNIKWIKALESGEYRQCQNRMYSDGSYCCLGVGIKVLYGDKALPSERQIVLKVDGEPIYSELCPEILSELGITELQRLKLIGMNDTGKSFKEIANYLRNLNAQSCRSPQTLDNCSSIREVQTR